MDRTPVDSTNITSIGYDEDSNTLEVEFHSGAIYQYFDVPLNVYQEMIQESSKGQYFVQHIKGYYRYVKV
ncbi:MAG: KTSC domain-containing protein [Bacteroidota bacterium]